MTALILLGVESAEQASEEKAVCVVRCLGHQVSVGDVLSTAIFEDGTSMKVDLRIVAILRYERPVGLLDPPHSAKLELAGTGELGGVRELHGDPR
ncbi:hypothetical protein [Amycolatopsis thailandensis]|uniref:Uncharacterized protein n=1 Tax=Amycolatopsis thailandensis TaxID=589330 RepID=A0A229SFK7_9PSEU|nr:hypothetical protein [Amycolatopsis thailandensis]OXM57707.1 hypothetical protein CFP71_06925 [Amycolatopsis thailandensis]